jgi:hypothetical protein
LAALSVIVPAHGVLMGLPETTTVGSMTTRQRSVLVAMI